MITWQPDTCGCKFEVLDQQQFLCQPLRKCEQHTAVADNNLLEVVHNQENRPKNRLAGIIREVLKISEDDDVKQGLIQFEFDAQRKLSFNIKDLTPAQKLAIMARLATSPDRTALKDLLKRN